MSKTSYAFGKPENSISERGTIALVKELLTDCTHFVDVGANDGLFTFASHSHFGNSIQIHCFEPDRDIYERLEKNLNANAIEAHGNRLAISDFNGTARFFKNLTDDSSGSLTNQFAYKHETVRDEVQAIRLSDYFRDHKSHNALVKIDVEGAGCEAWSGASDAAGEIRYLVMEMLAPEIRNELPSRLIGEGYFYAYYLRDFELLESPDGQYEYVAPFWNWLFCRLDPFRLIERLSGTRFHVVRWARG